MDIMWMDIPSRGTAQHRVTRALQAARRRVGLGRREREERSRGWCVTRKGLGFPAERGPQ